MKIFSPVTIANDFTNQTANTTPISTDSDC